MLGSKQLANDESVGEESRLIAKGDSVAVRLSDREIGRGEDRVGKDSLVPILESSRVPQTPLY